MMFFHLSVLSGTSVLRGPLCIASQASISQERLGQTSEGEVTETKPEATLRPHWSQPTPPGPASPAPPPALVSGHPERGAPGAELGHVHPAQRAIREGWDPPHFCGPGSTSQQRMNLPNLFSLTEFSFPVKSPSCLRLGLVLR